jgi:hypothetical protein
MPKSVKIKPTEKLGDIKDFFDGYDTAVYTASDDGYDYLEDGEYSVEVDNPTGEDHLIIDIFHDEFELWYGDWSAMYQNTESSYRHMKTDIENFLAGRMYLAVVTDGDEWVCSITINRSDVDKGYLKKQVAEYLRSANVGAWIDRMKADGAEISCRWWDSSRDQTLKLKPGEMR